MATITDFKIHKLHGYKNVNIKFVNNRLILVGENGSGKTTILRIFYYFLTCKWFELAKYNFNKITIKIDGEPYTLDYSTLKQNNSYMEKIFRQLPPPLRRRLSEVWEKGNLEEVEYLLRRYMSPRKFEEYRSYLYYNQLELFDKNNDDIVNEFKSNSQKLDKLTKELTEKVNFKILYLPTYRRIEQELSFIFKDYEIKEDIKEFQSKKMEMFLDTDKNHIELVQFGMNDVEEAKEKVLTELKEFQRNQLNTLTSEYLNDIVNKTYSTINTEKIVKTSEEDINKVLTRIDETLFNKKTKKKLKEIINEVKSSKNIIDDEYKKVVCHYFIKLLDSQEKLQLKEMKMKDFCRICNKYINDKLFDYESSTFDFSIKTKNNLNETIDFSQLSSGEKQIVSLFSLLYLLQKDDYFIIIDEPELSLSVIWQKEFLVDIQNSPICKGLFAVTHSPFIYQNVLEKYTHGLGEFYK